MTTIITSRGRIKDSKKEIEEAIASLVYEIQRTDSAAHERVLRKERAELENLIRFGKTAGKNWRN